MAHHTATPKYAGLPGVSVATALEAVSHKHMDYYLDEFTFHLNRRRSMSRGKLFFRLAQPAATVDPATRYRLFHPKLSKSESEP